MSDATTSPEDPRPPARRVSWLVGLVLLQALVMGVLTIVLIVALATSHRDAQVWFTYAEIGLCALVVFGLVAGASALRRDRHWPRSMLITLELVGLAISGRLVQFHHWLLGVPAVVVILLTLVLLFVTAAAEQA